MGQPPGRVGRQRGTADARLRGDARARVRRGRPRRRLRHRRLPAPVRRPRRARDRASTPRPACSSSPAPRARGVARRSATCRRSRTPTTRSTSSPASRRSSSPTTSSPRCARPAGSPAGRAGRDPGLRRPRALRPRGGEGRDRALPRRGARGSTGARARSRSCCPPPGLTLDTAFDLTWAYEYADDAALVEAMLAAGGAAAIAGPDREAELGSRHRSKRRALPSERRPLSRLERVARRDRSRSVTGRAGRLQDTPLETRVCRASLSRRSVTRQGCRGGGAGTH